MPQLQPRTRLQRPEVGSVTVHRAQPDSRWLCLDLHPFDGVFPFNDPNDEALRELRVELRFWGWRYVVLLATTKRADRLPGTGATELIALTTLVDGLRTTYQNHQVAVPASEMIVRIHDRVASVVLQWNDQASDRFLLPLERPVLKEDHPSSSERYHFAGRRRRPTEYDAAIHKG